MIAGLIGPKVADALAAHEVALRALRALVRRRQLAAAVRALDAALADNARRGWLRGRAVELVEVVRQPLAATLTSSDSRRRRRALALLATFADILERHHFNPRS